MTAVWIGWLIVLVVSFGVFETYALVNNKITLSRFIWGVSKAFPLLPWIAGVLCGGLAVHFWWGGAMCFAPVQ
jgi:hypothetical protein